MYYGPEFTGRALDEWAYRHGVKPRDERLNANYFLSLDDARRKIEAWRVEYNSERPHASLG